MVFTLELWFTAFLLFCQPRSFWLVYASLAARVSVLLLSVHFLYQLISSVPNHERKPFCVCAMNLFVLLKL